MKGDLQRAYMLQSDRNDAMRGLKAQQPSFYIVDARRDLLCQLLVGWSVTFMNEGRNDMVVQ
ncbi:MULTISPECIES: hypothetical protein [Paraburkholderia]|jgi:hypothetical protein|uniref:Uncharacterized protein n=2 Tax=Paraburkholderia TaxID=1822464 RepID=A0ABW9AQP0_9BURK